MDYGKTRVFYRAATQDQLKKLYDEAKTLDKKGDSLKAQHSSMLRHLVKTIKEKFPNAKETMYQDSGTIQIMEMEKQWRTTAASMVTVKRSIKLPGFHTGRLSNESLNLYVNSKYGIKIHKRYSGYSPFKFISIFRQIDNDSPFKMDVNVLEINNHNGFDLGRLNFSVLDAIPQLDKERIRLLKHITQEIVWMVDSWRNFFKKQNNDFIERITQIEFLNEYSTDDQLRHTLNNLDALVTFNKQLTIDLDSQTVRWQETVEKWKGLNKNFLVLNELRKSELKV